MTIDELYKFIQFIANKEQRGFIKPSEFNMLAERAQIDLIHDRFARYKAKDRPSLALEQNNSVIDDIHTLVTQKRLSYNNIPIPQDDVDNWNTAYPGEPFPYQYLIDQFNEEKYGVGSWQTPDDYLHFIQLKRSTSNPDDLTFNQFNTLFADLPYDNIELLTHDQYLMRKESVLNPIDAMNLTGMGGKAVAVVVEGGFRIYKSDSYITAKQTWTSVTSPSYSTFPGTVSRSDYLLEYIRKPKKPHWGYTMVNNMYVFNPSSPNTVELELSEKTHSEVAQRMLSYIGISLRDQEPLGYAEAKVQDQKKS